MSYSNSETKNKHPKVYFQQYLDNANEPKDDKSSDVLREGETELSGNSFEMRRKFRHIAQQIRGRYL